MDNIAPEINLKICNVMKAIPYPAVDHGDSINHGFKVLKNNPSEAAKIAEVQDNPHLQNALVKINGENTPFFTVGCEKAYISTNGKHWVNGFIEIAFNPIKLVADAQFYFKAFYEFNRFATKNKFKDPIMFSWQLEQAHFMEKNIDGFTACIWIQTAYLDDMDSAKKYWNSSVDFLTDFLSMRTIENDETLY